MQRAGLKTERPNRPHCVKICFSDPAPAHEASPCELKGEDRARLKAPPGLLIPPDFLLVDISAGKAHEARAAGRRYSYVGVAIRTQMDLAEPTTRMGQRLRTLWLGVIN